MSYYDDELEAPLARLPVYQGDRVVGTVPASFMPDPSASRSAMYDVRPGDWTPTSDGWRVNMMLGLGDPSPLTRQVIRYRERNLNPNGSWRGW